MYIVCLWSVSVTSEGDLDARGHDAATPLYPTIAVTTSSGPCKIVSVEYVVSREIRLALFVMLCIEALSVPSSPCARGSDTCSDAVQLATRRTSTRRSADGKVRYPRTRSPVQHGCYHWCSAFVAALFAIHPLHVESVAWISERKDVLSAFFAFAALYGYVRYVETPSARRYAVFASLFAIGLMAKPMLVTFPFLLLLP